MTLDPDLDAYLPPDYAPNVIVVMAKSCGPGIWRAAGGAITIEELGIPVDLAGRVSRWSEELAALVKEPTAPQRSERLAALAADGLTIARQIQTAVGSKFEVLYFDEAKLEAEAAFSEYLFPVV